MLDLANTASAALGGGLLGAGVKLLAGLASLYLRNKENDRKERLGLAGKQITVLEMRPDPNSDFVSYTRRILAWCVCFTFCAICLLWSIFPGYPLLAEGGDTGTKLNLFLFSWQLSRDLGITLTTGAIVWQLIPFMSMILMTYFTPDISKIR